MPSPTDNILAVVRGRVIELFDSTSGNAIGDFTPEPLIAYPMSMSFSPDGKMLAVASYREVAIIDVVAGATKGILKGHSGLVTRVSFSGDGRRIITEGQEGRISFWDALTFQRLISLKGLALPVSLSPDGRTLVTSSLRGVHIWRGATDEEVARQRGK